MISKPGLFITIEGVEGAGKSTLARALAERLRAAGHEVAVTQEPGGDMVAQRIRKLVLDSSNVITDRAELLLFEAARAQHVDAKIRPLLDKGTIVISDRYADSSVAYQGYARGLDLDQVRLLNDYATGGLKPDITILLDLPVEVGLARQRRMDRMSSEGLAFHESVRQGFLDLAKDEPERVVVVDATQPFKDVLSQVHDAIIKRMLAAAG